MKYRLLGNSGLRVSEICLGTMTFGDDWGQGSAKNEAQLSQLNDNLTSLDLSLSAQQLKTLDEASRIDLGFPQTMFAKTSFADSCPGAWQIESLREGFAEIAPLKWLVAIER